MKRLLLILMTISLFETPLWANTRILSSVIPDRDLSTREVSPLKVSTPEVSTSNPAYLSRKIGYHAKKYELSFTTPWAGFHYFQDSISPLSMYEKGRLDAKTFYKNRGAFWMPVGTLVLSSFALQNPLPGYGAGLAIGLIKPKEKNFKLHDIRYRSPEMRESIDQLFQDRLYVEGYRKGARGRKLGNAARGMGIATVSGLVIGGVIALILLKGA